MIVTCHVSQVTRCHAVSHLTVGPGVSVDAGEALLRAAEAGVGHAAQHGVVRARLARDRVHHHLAVRTCGPQKYLCVLGKYLETLSPIMFSSVILTPLGVNSGRPSGNPSTGAPLTCLPSTATRGLSLNLRTRGNYCYYYLDIIYAKKCHENVI